MINKMMRLKALAIRAGVAFFIWQCLAYVHLMTWYFDTISFRPEYNLDVKDFLYYFLAYGCWAIFSLILFECMKTIKQPTLIQGYISIFILGLVLWLPSYFIIDYAINSWLNEATAKGIIEQLLGTPNALIFFYGIVYALSFVACMSVLMYQNARESQLNALKFEALQSDTQLQLLKSQLGPHFLFNCLGSISALARTESKNELLSTVNKVGNLLRYTIESAKYKRVLLQDELVFVEDYIALQKLRFGSRFEYHASIDDTALNVQTPPFLIQPLIENAFVHAVDQTEKAIQIHLRIFKKDKQLSICVSNTNVDIETRRPSFGSAISNLRTRLEMTFKKNYSLNHGRDDGLYISNLCIPLGAKA